MRTVGLTFPEEITPVEPPVEEVPMEEPAEEKVPVEPEAPSKGGKKGAK